MGTCVRNTNPTTELCTGGLDEDCDGLTDCADTADCSGDPACQTSQTCSQLSGSCCTSGQSCSGGSFQTSSDCASLCCVGGTCQASGGSPDPIIHYTFDEGYGTQIQDSSGNGNHAQLIANPSWVTGRSGYAVSFNGISQYGETNYVDHLPRWTVSVWIRADNPPGAGSDTGPVMKEENFLILHQV